MKEKGTTFLTLQSFPGTHGAVSAFWRSSCVKNFAGWMLKFSLYFISLLCEIYFK